MLAGLVPAYVLWYPGRLRRGLEFGSPAVTDALFLAGYALFVVALAKLIHRRSAADRRVDLLDTLIIGAGAVIRLLVSVVTAPRATPSPRR